LGQLIGGFTYEYWNPLSRFCLPRCCLSHVSYLFGLKYRNLQTRKSNKTLRET
jgi:hypothetical protein